MDGRPNPEDWADLHQELRILITDEVKSWELDLTRLDRPDSHALGMLLTLAATIKNRGGLYKFLIAAGSPLDHLIQATKVDQIINVRVA